MSDKKAELAKKRALLNELRRKKSERTQTLQAHATTAADTELSSNACHVDGFTTTATTTTADPFDNLNVDEILKKCGMDHLLHNNNNSCLFGSTSHTSASFASSTNCSHSMSMASSLNDEKSIELARQRMEQMSLTIAQPSHSVINIFPKELITYSKETQTSERLTLAKTKPPNRSLADRCNEPADDTGEGNRHHADDDDDDDDDDGQYADDDDDEDDHGASATATAAKNKRPPLAFYEDVFVYDTLQWEDDDELNDPYDHTHKQKCKNNKNALLHVDYDDDGDGDGERVGRNRHGNMSSTSENYYDDDLIDIEAVMHNNAAGLEKYSNIDHVRDGHHNNNNNDDDDEDDNDDEGGNVSSLLRFLSVKRPVMERALKQNEASDISFDYTRKTNMEKQRDLANQREETMQLKRVLTSSQWASSVITCLDWSTQYAELVLCSYDDNNSKPCDYYGCESDSEEAVCAIWNVKSEQKSAQQYFTSTSSITQCAFSSFHPSLIVAGTYSGQLLIWDMRVDKRTPSQRSSLSLSAHLNPVYCVHSVASDLISISSDGKLCSWSLENLNAPYHTQDLSAGLTGGKSLYAMCMDFQSPASSVSSSSSSQLNSNSSVEQQHPQQQRTALIGTQDGMAHSLHCSLNNKKFNFQNTFDNHSGPLTSLSCYPFEHSHLFLTSSFDSSVKLWSTQDNSAPIYSFECHNDYVYDVAWSPRHPALFACVDGSGRLDLWDLRSSSDGWSDDMFEPSMSLLIENGTRSLNKIKWSPTGSELAVGDENGSLHIFELSASLVEPTADDTTRVAQSIANLRQLSDETRLTRTNSTDLTLIDRHHEFNISSSLFC